MDEIQSYSYRCDLKQSLSICEVNSITGELWVTWQLKLTNDKVEALQTDLMPSLINLNSLRTSSPKIEMQFKDSCRLPNIIRELKVKKIFGLEDASFTCKLCQVCR